MKKTTKAKAPVKTAKKRAAAKKPAVKKAEPVDEETDGSGDEE